MSSLQSRVTVVLCRPIYPRNIGMCARAMANMGLERLVLIAPQKALDLEAKQGATSAQDILSNAKIYDSLEAFYREDGEGVRIALSARPGQLRAPERLDLKIKSLINKKDSSFTNPEVPIFLFFGTEDDGLNDAEIRDCNHICYLPTFGSFHSMNLSHAVMLTSYMMRAAFDETSHLDSLEKIEEALRASRRTGESLKPKSEGEIQKLQLKAKHAPKIDSEKTIQTWLETLGFNLENRHVNAARVITRLLLESEPTREELRVLESVIQQTIRKLN